MKKNEMLLDAIGEVDEMLVRQAKQKKKKRMAVRLTVASLAACLALVFSVPFVRNTIVNFVSPQESSAELLMSGTPLWGEEVGETEMLLAWEDIAVYYVDGGKLSSITEYLPCSPQPVFEVWKEQNGIGGEVELLYVRIESNAETTYSEFEGEGVAEHKVGDYFVLNLTLSENIRTYYDRIDETLLLDSLKKTLSYSSIEYDEYRITFA